MTEAEQSHQTTQPGNTLILNFPASESKRNTNHFCSFYTTPVLDIVLQQRKKPLMTPEPQASALTGGGGCPEVSIQRSVYPSNRTNREYLWKKVRPQCQTAQVQSFLLAVWHRVEHLASRGSDFSSLIGSLPPGQCGQEWWIGIKVPSTLR